MMQGSSHLAGQEPGLSERPAFLRSDDAVVYRCATGRRSSRPERGAVFRVVVRLTGGLGGRRRTAQTAAPEVSGKAIPEILRAPSSDFQHIISGGSSFWPRSL
eukprot:TRINITY_DN30329_c0_g1_i1.p2 TRINITY_DN30329_c0_g1~~TRINITY_DN30329_c0_g1_i1.p2  ORF type:complete len:103 (+),score=3.97 TRINITY_DN30329_c0_g1_i1:224-532(+)